ncbi:sigma factor-like helix-turn-helix DNA-binding protein [Methylomonas koyamae]|uniref:sigma factor-like helix-turn-helix DNA-binding protein n=1 Tax=Methylomonas koyamae TaxID=702114 RepID=UPI002110618C|nr:sigma factor-like helix-turn-helix DNA-binding protein [Methylomonas koyamae]
MAFFRGLSHDEIAESCGLPLGTVKSHIRRALQSMQHLLTADFGEVDRTDD